MPLLIVMPMQPDRLQSAGRKPGQMQSGIAYPVLWASPGEMVKIPGGLATEPKRGLRDGWQSLSRFYFILKNNRPAVSRAKMIKNQGILTKRCQWFAFAKG